MRRTICKDYVMIFLSISFKTSLCHIMIYGNFDFFPSVFAKLRDLREILPKHLNLDKPVLPPATVALSFDQFLEFLTKFCTH